MLVVEPERRLTLNQISSHRWMLLHSAGNEENTTTKETVISIGPPTLDSIVIAHMLNLPNLTFDEISESIHSNSFNHVFGIYNLLVDKLELKKKEQQKLQQHAGMAYSR